MILTVKEGGQWAGPWYVRAYTWWLPIVRRRIRLRFDYLSVPDGQTIKLAGTAEFYPTIELPNLLGITDAPRVQLQQEIGGDPRRERYAIAHGLRSDRIICTPDGDEFVLRTYSYRDNIGPIIPAEYRTEAYKRSRVLARIPRGKPFEVGFGISQEATTYRVFDEDTVLINEVVVPAAQAPAPFRMPTLIHADNDFGRGVAKGRIQAKVREVHPLPFLSEGLVAAALIAGTYSYLS